ncbi:hypothetical protein CSAL01_08047 [Colletotrichum salicis]|uniref:Secreted protein n=1 Tax=Colletotrichum salicis TaxID=1209931 RepID=A0A135SFP3_9PEZI|nr:hypothetical protein CSAL01_08047 [Colletotrichum salicis]
MHLPKLLVTTILLRLGATAAVPIEDVADIPDAGMAKPPAHIPEKPWMIWGMCAVASNQCIIHGPHGERRYQCKNFVRKPPSVWFLLEIFGT